MVSFLFFFVAEDKGRQPDFVESSLLKVFLSPISRKVGRRRNLKHEL